MENRKLQSTGGSSLSVILPKKWIKSLALKGKDAVGVGCINQSDLVIQSQKIREKKSRTIFPIDGIKPEILRKEFVSLYILGFEEIILRAKSIQSAQRESIQKVTDLFIGFEIISESSQEIQFKNILDTSKFSVSQSIEKMFFTTKAMLSDIQRALKEDDAILAANVIRRDKEIDKLYLAISRQFHSCLLRDYACEEGLSFFDLYFFHYVASQVERVADHVVKIASLVELRSKNESHQLPYAKIFLTAETIFNSALKMVLSMDRNLAHKMLKEIKESRSETDFDKNKVKKASQTEIIILDSLKRMKDYVKNLAEITIDQSVLRDTERDICPGIELK